MPCSLKRELIDQTIAFHGHNCPGLTIGIRAAELAIKELNITGTSSTVCVTETDMCGVDAIQFLTNCTFGKGNMIHRDYGKSAFTFFDRDTKKGFRAVFNDRTARDETDREQRIELLLDAELEDLFDLEPVTEPPVRPERILKSIPCDDCGEKTMESRVRLFDGRHLCFPCFQKVEQKI